MARYQAGIQQTWNKTPLSTQRPEEMPKGRDFPGGPVAKAPYAHCRGPGFDPWSGNQRADWWLGSKESACHAGDVVQSLGREDPPEEDMATQSSVLAWRIPGTEEPGRPQPMWSERLSMHEPRELDSRCHNYESAGHSKRSCWPQLRSKIAHAAAKTQRSHTVKY